MPIYHFHSEDAAAPNADADRRELVDDQVAISEGKTAAIEALLDDLVRVEQDEARVVVTVKRADGSIVSTIVVQAEVRRVSSGSGNQVV